MQQRNILLPHTITPDSFETIETRLHILLYVFVTILSLILNFPQLLSCVY